MRSGCPRPTLKQINHVASMKQFVLNQHQGSASSLVAGLRPTDLELLMFEQLLERASAGNYRVLKSEDLKWYVTDLWRRDFGVSAVAAFNTHL